MAFTSSFVTDSVMGKYRLRVHDVTADAATGSIDTGLKRVTWGFQTLRSGVTNIANYTENALPEGTAAAGNISLTGAVSGDVYRIVSFGPS